MTADQDVQNAINGASTADPTGFNQFSMVRGRARKRLGDVINKLPFTRSWTINGVTTNVAATPSDIDHATLAAEQVGYRYVDSTNAVRDFGDQQLIKWEYFLLTADAATLAQAIANASVERPWPAGYTGNAPFDTP